jgi:hypothetical protein
MSIQAIDNEVQALKDQIEALQNRLKPIADAQRELRMYGICGDEPILWLDTTCLEGLETVRDVDFAFRRWANALAYTIKPAQWVHETKGE